MTHLSLSRRAALAGLASLTAMRWRSARAQDQRPVVVGQTFLAESLDPAEGVASWALQSHGVAETLFTVDRNGALAPQLARAVERDGEAWIVHLQSGIRFADGAPLTAAAVRDALARSAAANPRATGQTGRLAFAVLDPLRLRIATERPVPTLAPVLAEFPMVIYRVAGDRFHFTGPFRVVEYRRGDLIRLEPNPEFRSPGTRPAVVIRRIGDPQALALALEAGELDLAFNLPTEALARLRRRDGITVKSTAVAYQYMLLLNTARAPLDDARVRRAFDLAVDRAALTQVLGAGEIATGMYPSFMPFAVTAPRASALARAEALLEEAGWRRAGSGPRQRDGRALEITLTAYPQRPDFLTILPVVKAQLEQAGFRVRAETTEAITPQLQAKRFDAAFWAMHTAPGGDGAFVLEQYLRSSGPLNFMSYASPAFDATLDRLRETEAPQARADLMRAAHEPLFADAPIAFLLTPVWHIGLSRRLAGYEPSPSDYYILRADLSAQG